MYVLLIQKNSFCFLFQDGIDDIILHTHPEHKPLILSVLWQQANSCFDCILWGMNLYHFPIFHDSP